MGEVIFLSESHFDCDSILLFISNAAISVAALSLPIPLVFKRFENESEAKTAKFLFLLINSCATLITDFPFIPVLRRIAISSASVKFWTPLKINFSLGRSSKGKSFIFKISAPPF